MALYCMLSNLGPDGWKTVSENPQRIRIVNEEVEAMGLKIVGQYALMGQYDFLTLIEADDPADMARVAVALSSRGTMKTLTLPAFHVEDFISYL